MNIVTAEGIEYLLLALAMSAALLIFLAWILYHVFFYKRKGLLEIKLELSTKDQQALDNFNASLSKRGFTTMDVNSLSSIKSVFFDRVNKAYLKAKK